MDKRRAKVSVTVAPDLLEAVDSYVSGHPDLDRSKVIGEALALWYAREQDAEMAEQFAGEPGTPDGVDAAEWQAWKRVRAAAAGRRFGRR